MFRYILGLLVIISLNDCNRGVLGEKSVDTPVVELGLLALRGNRLTISGTAVKGVIRNGLVTISTINSDGTCNSNPIEVTKTDGQGNYSLTYQRIGSSVCLTVGPNPDGSSVLFDEKNSKDIPIPGNAKFRLTTIYPESKILDNKKSYFTISPFSRMLSKRLQVLIRQSNGNADIAKLHTRASRELVIRFGLNKGLNTGGAKNISLKQGKNLSINDPEVQDLEDILIELQKPDSVLTTKFVSILMGFSHLANKYKRSNEFSIDDLEAIMDALANDFADGIFDGKDENGKPITIGSGANQIALPADVLKDLILPAITAYFQEGGTFNVGYGVANITINPIQISTGMQFQGLTPIISEDTTATNTQYTVGGTISGLTGTGLVLLNNGGDSLSIPSGATSFTFATPVNSGSAYSVTISASPVGLACAVSNGSGTANGNITNIAISCAAGKTVGGTISGLNSAGLILQLNGTNYSVNSGATNYTFPFAIATGSSYTVGIAQQPAGLACSVSNPTGTASANITNANVICVGSGVFSIQVTWSRNGDLDLAVGTPNLAYISHGGSADGGTQDRDASDMGPENVFWTATPPSGTYYICLDTHSFSPAISGTDPVGYTVTVRKNGNLTNTFTGNLNAAVSASTCNSGSPHKVAEVAWP